MSDPLMRLVDVDNFEELFRKLGWSKPDAPREFEANDIHFDKVATYRGLGVWVCYQLPTRSEQRLADSELAKINAERLVIFTDGGKQDWRWPRHSKLGSVNAKLMAHRHEMGKPDPDLRERLEAMRIGLDDAPTLPALVERMRVVFDRESESASSRAARLMGRLYEELAQTGMESSQATQLLARLLFLWFGDDTDMWRKDTFHNWLAEHTTPRNFTSKLNDLFKVVNNPQLDDHPWPATVPEEYRGLRYINGGLFAQDLTIPQLPPQFRDEVIEASGFDWSIISPAIFGSMFQTVKDTKSRREMGEHYTTEENILKTLRPLFLDELEEKLEEAWDSKSQLTRLHSHLASIHILDPACGCGNFLIVAYRELRALELRLITRRRELDRMDGIFRKEHQPRLQGDGMEDTVVRMSNFAGIELEEWPAAIASTAMLLVDHLANQNMAEELGASLVRLPIDHQNRVNIQVANALHIDWNSIVSPSEGLKIVGNPPFVGYNDRTASQRADLELVWQTTKIGRLDYVTAWYKKAAEFLDGTPNAEFAFVSTNSISQGEPVPLLFRPLFELGWLIKFAYQTFEWTSEAPGKAASVHCVIVGMTQQRQARRTLFITTADGDLVARNVNREINAYLIDATNVIVDKRTKPLAHSIPPVTNGSVAGDTLRGEENLGGLVMSREEGEELILNRPILRPAIRKFVGGQNFLKGEFRYCIWLPDGVPPEMRNDSELTRRLNNVAEVREQSTEPSTQVLASTPWKFKHTAQPTTEYVCIPRTVSQNRDWLAVGFIDPSVIVSNGSFWASDPSGLIFSVISSGMFMAWQFAIGGRLKSDPRFANTIVWNNFPLPDLTDEQRRQIIDAGKKVISARAAHPERSLAEHYNSETMDPGLLRAHIELDRVVDEAFGARGTSISTEERQVLLFDQYAKMVKS